MFNVAIKVLVLVSRLPESPLPDDLPVIIHSVHFSERSAADAKNVLAPHATGTLDVVPALLSFKE